jgi:hypothetical protein
MNDKPTTFKEEQQAVKQEQQGFTKEEVMALMQKRNQFAVDLDALTPQSHRWVDRGQVMSCEGGDHPHHRVFKRR